MQLKKKNPFTVEHSQLGTLHAIDATALVRELLWCEVKRLRISPHRVEISLRTTVADGGIDANVDAEVVGDSFLSKGVTSFQIKAGESFKPWQKTHINKELFGKASNPQTLKNLASGVRACCDASGTYIVVVPGHDPTPQQLNSGVRLLKDALKHCGYKNAKVSILGQTQLASMISFFPALLYRLHGLSDHFFLDYNTWKQRVDMQPALKLGQPQETFLEGIRAGLRSSETPHIRVIGEPGIGKTRLVLEALSLPEFQSLVIYAPLGYEFQNSQLLLDLVRLGNELQAIVVVDDCPEKERASIWLNLKGKSGIRLITLDHGPDRSRDSTTSMLHCPQLTQKEIEEILQGYVGDSRFLSRWSEMCEGSPRVAHAVGENLQLNPNDVLKPPATVPIWDRFISGYQQLESAESRQLLMVMRHLALFEKFGFDEPVQAEGRYIASLVQEADPTITWAVFQELVEKLRDRRILQGKRTLVIVPRLLHIHLWLDFWKSHGRDFDFAGRFREMPQSLQHWFLRLFSYAHANPISMAVVGKLLGRGGPFDEPDFLLNDYGARFLGYLTEADAGSAVRLLQRTVATWPAEKLKTWNSSRQSVVWALEKIAVWREHFAAAAEVLIAMALHENATNSNNSTGTLKDLFVIGDGWAATQATPQERFQVIKGLLESNRPERRKLALTLCAAWCSTSGHTRRLGAEFQGLRDELPFWRPKTYGEVFDAWRMLWPALFSLTRQWSDVERRAANDTIVTAGQSLLLTVMAVDVVDTWTQLESDTATDLEALTHAVIFALRFRTGRPPRRIAARLRKLDQLITGKSFWKRFQRFVVFTCWEEGYRPGSEDSNETPLSRRVEKLARELAKSPGLLAQHLKQLVEMDGRRLFEFGQKYGEFAGSRALTGRIIRAQLNVKTHSSMRFLAGYMAAIKACDAEEWDQTVLGLLADPSQRLVAQAIVSGIGFSPAVLDAALRLIPVAEIPSSFFYPLIFDAYREQVDAALVGRAVAALTKKGTPDASHMAIKLAERFYCQSAQPRAFHDVQVIERLLLRSSEVSPETDQTMHWYYWKRVVEEFCRRFPQREMAVFEAFLAHLDDVEVGDRKEIGQVALHIAQRRPSEVWPLVSKALEGDLSDTYRIRSWLGGPHFAHRPSVSPITFFDPDIVIGWALQNREARRYFIKGILPKTLADQGGGQLTRTFIDKLMQDEDEGYGLISHFQTGAWTGLRSDHLRGLRDQARSWLSDSNSSSVARWLAKYLAVLGEEIDRAEIDEERRGY